MKAIVYSPGEPSGIGPDLIIQLCNSSFWKDVGIPIICIADSKLLEDRAKLIGTKIRIKSLKKIDDCEKNILGALQVINITKCSNTKAGKLYKSNALYVLDNLRYSIEQAINNKRIAVVTGPISKENIISVDKKFSGHTEYIRDLTKSDDVLMLLGSDKLRVAIATTHIPLKKVSKAITKKLILNKIKILHDELQSKFNIKNPRIKLLGLNPHAGEGGKIGTEESDILIPAVKELRKRKINVSMPI